MLQLQDVNKSIDGQSILSHINLRVADGETHALIGSSGSGKTTILRVTLGLVPFDSGYIRINDQPLLSFKRAEWAERIGYVPQEGGLFPHLTAAQNVELVAKLRGWEKTRMQKRLEEVGTLVELDPLLLGRFPHELSGGQVQRISIMRAAFLNPSVMLLDEPMGALDPLIRRALQHELKHIFKRLAKTVVIVTHDFSEAVYLAEKITLLQEGKIIQSGGYMDLLNSPASPFVTQFINAHRTLPHEVSQ